ncbi:RNA polymerase sigma factor [Phytohabitans rumicis]|nr:sigma-70 family RNA polymerase sigma factor [Phytohabitans rumicis]
MDDREVAALVVAAQSGDQRALDDLVADCLPLVYNIVGRALDGHADVDDVVQETMLRAVHGLRRLRDPASFRPWLVAITMRQVRDQGRARRAALARRGGTLDEAGEVADPGADFADLTVVRLGLSGQRREVAEATRWLDENDRHLLSLWWLEAAGELTRTELAAALDISPQHAAVRVQRMKAQLDTARAVVRALAVTPRCSDLAALTDRWPGQPHPLWRKRLGRHTRECPVCGPGHAPLVPAENLLVGLAMVPVPLGFALNGLTGAGGVLAKLGALFSKPVAAIVAGVTVAAGGATVAYTWQDPDPRGTAVFAAAPTPSPTPPARRATPAQRRPTTPAAPAYGSTVDVADKAPADRLRPPGALPKRPTSGLVAAVGGAYQEPEPGNFHMVRRGERVVLRGRGYVRIRYQIPFTQRSGGMTMPTWTGLSGKLFHVASGGTRRMDDAKPGGPAANTWMGEPAAGYTVLPAGAQQFWQAEYFYLDGEVTLHNNERGADYNLTVRAVTWDDVAAEIATPPPADPVAAGWVRYGLVRDTGTDAAPVPQYLTRQTPSDPATVPQSSKVSPD